MDWPLLFAITGISVVGILIGSMIGRRVEGRVLKKRFWMVRSPDGYLYHIPRINRLGKAVETVKAN